MHYFHMSGHIQYFFDFLCMLFAIVIIIIITIILVKNFYSSMLINRKHPLRKKYQTSDFDEWQIYSLKLKKNPKCFLKHKTRERDVLEISFWSVEVKCFDMGLELSVWKIYEEYVLMVSTKFILDTILFNLLKKQQKRVDEDKICVSIKLREKRSPREK